MEKWGEIIRKPAFDPAAIGFFLVALIGTVLLTIFHPDFQVISGFYLILSQFYLGYFILYNNHHSEINLSFSLFSFSLAGWNLLALLITNSESVRPFFLADWLIFVMATMMILFLFDFTLVFPKPKPYFNWPARLASLFMPLFLVVFLLINHRFIITSVKLVRGIRTPLFGPGYNIFSAYTIGYLFLAGFSLLQSYRQGGKREKAQLYYFLVGAFFSVTGFLITNLILPWTGMASLEWMGAWFSLVFIAFTAYAITKHQLMDISVVINRTLAELMSIFLLGTAYLSLVSLYRANVSNQINPLFLALTVFYGIFVGQVHHPFRMFLQTTSEKIFLRGKYDYYKELSAASSRVVEKLSLPDILRVLYQTFRDVMEISSPKIMLPENFVDPVKSSKQYVVFDAVTAKPAEPEETITFDDPLVKRLIGQRSPLFDASDPARELIVPCLLEDRLIALFVFGRKLSEDPFTEEDIRLLQALGSQAAVAFDHTLSYEKIRADLEVAEKQLNRSQRLAAVGTLTAGVTHEIRNPLTVIRSETERLTRQPRDADYLKQYQALLLKHIDRIAGIVERMLGLAKEKEHCETDVVINEIAEATLQCFPLDRLKVVNNLRPVPPVKGDPDEIQEVFINLIQNASEAMPSGGTLTLKSYRDDGHVVVEITDTGKGIPAEIREKIFDPFFSTRHEGVGLGLSIVYRIVREHGGDIKVESEVGKGTTFKLLFPTMR